MVSDTACPLYSFGSKGRPSTFSGGFVTSYAKPHKSYDEQLELLKSRGLHVADDKVALHHLRTVGYYTLGGYLYSMRVLEGQARTDTFLRDASFEHLVRLYNFDCSLRHLCLEALEVIERAIKVKVAYNVGRHDAMAHHTGSALSPDALAARPGQRSRHAQWLEDHTCKATSRNHDAIAAFIRKYGPDLPIWVATDAMDFGDVSRLFGMLDQSWQSNVAKAFDLQSAPQMGSWTRAMCSVRNIAAHHERMWNRKLVDSPMKPKGKEAKHFAELAREDQEVWARPYAALLVIAYFMDRINRDQDWTQRMGVLLTTLPLGPGVSYQALGAPKIWMANPFWGL